jgi:hypothetical protein
VIVHPGETPGYRAHCWMRWHQTKLRGDEAGIAAIMARRVELWVVTRALRATRVRRPDMVAVGQRWSSAGRAAARYTTPRR